MELLQKHGKIFKFHSKIPEKITSRESSWLEFKESFNWMTKEKYVKSMVAFANNKGGFLVFGVTNNPRYLRGLRGKNFEETDEAKITGYLNSVFSPEVNFKKFVLTVKGKKVGLIYTHQSINKPIVCIKGGGIIKEAEIYYRYNARSDKIKYPELLFLLREIREQEQKNWMDHFEKISKIGTSNAAVLDVARGQISGQGGTLVIDKKLIPKLKFIKEGNFKEKGLPTLKLIGDVKPVSIEAYRRPEDAILQITNDSTAPMVRIKEDVILRAYSLNYGELTEILRDKYADFKLNHEYHKIRNQIKKNEKFCRTRYLDPSNKKSSKKDFYHPQIIKEFGKHYTSKTKKNKK